MKEKTGKVDKFRKCFRDPTNEQTTFSLENEMGKVPKETSERLATTSLSKSIVKQLRSRVRFAIYLILTLPLTKIF